MRIALWIIVALIVIGIYLSWLAGRLDRLHVRVEKAWSQLDAQLVRRSSVVVELAGAGVLDPATAVLLLGAARDARDTEEEGRELAESDLSRALRAAFDDPDQARELRDSAVAGDLVTELAAAVGRVRLARRFHNEAVRVTQLLRRRRLVRYFRLAGRAALPMPFEMDDEPPAALMESAG
jgi:hypothetical protein